MPSLFLLVSELDTVELLCRCLEPHGGGKIATVNPRLRDTEVEKIIPSNIQRHKVMVATAHDPAINAAFASTYYRLFGKWLEEGKFKGNRFRVVPGGLAGIDSGLNEMEAGKVRNCCFFMGISMPSQCSRKY
jgi:hypothetical protein